MDVSNIASLATALSSTQTNDAVGISVLKKAWISALLMQKP